MNAPSPMHRRPRRGHRDPAWWGLAALALSAAAFFLLPLYVMAITSLKPMEEIRLGHLFAWPAQLTFDAWHDAWMSACTGVACEGIRGGFWNSVSIVLPSTIIAIALGALNGYALAYWRARGAALLFGLLTIGAFIPVQVLMFPLVRMLGPLHLVGSLPGIVLLHVIFSMPIMTLIFRNHFAALPRELFLAARLDGAGFLRIFVLLMLPLSVPMLVVAASTIQPALWARSACPDRSAVFVWFSDPRVDSVP